MTPEEKAAEALRRYEVRFGPIDEAGEAEIVPPTGEDPSLEEAVAEAAGAEPETIDLPSQLARAVLIYELEDGRFGFRPIAGTMPVDMDAVMSLIDRCERRATVDLIAMQVAAKLTAGRRPPGTVSPIKTKFGFRRNQ